MINSLEFAEEFDEQNEIQVQAAQVSQAVLFATDWTVETVLSQLQRGNIDLTPRFQRRDAWKRTRKSRFIESLLLGLPIPQLVFAEKQDKRGQFLVLDGKQRLLTLLQFIGAAEGKNNQFRLTDLTVRSDLNGKNFADLEKDPNDWRQLNNHTIRSVILRHWPNLDFLHLVFVRLNAESTPLSPQELRQAAFPGPFTDFIDDAAFESQALKILFDSEEADFRMRDLELLLRYLAFAFFITDYAGNLKKFLDDTSKKMNDTWMDQQVAIKQQVHQFEQAIEAAGQIFGVENLGRKWTAEAQYTARLNRSVLDVIVFYFADEQIRAAALDKKEAVEKAFQEIFQQDAFRQAIETSTNTLSAVSTRYLLWGEKLRECLGLNFTIPTLRPGGRIQFPGFWRR